MNDCLIICHTIKRAHNLFTALCAHFKERYGISVCCDKVRRTFRILTTDIRVVTDHEYELKCKTGFRGKVITEEEAWRLLEQEDQKNDSISNEGSGS